MIQREDMLELTRRMTPARASVSRMAGAYLDEDGYVDGTFHTHFLKLSPAERDKNLKLAKQILLSETNEQLKEYKITEAQKRPGSIWQLLEGLKEAELKNDAFLDIFYELLGEAWHPGIPYSCFWFFGQYDVPVKGRDGEWLEGSEEVYSYLLCCISPLQGEYEPGKPVFGFLYPAFRDRTTREDFVNIFEAEPGTYTCLRELLWK